MFVVPFMTNGFVKFVFGNGEHMTTGIFFERPFGNKSKNSLVANPYSTTDHPAKNLHGVVLVTKLGGDIISNQGLFYGLLLTAVISLNLVIFNLLPIPALDGGQIMFLVIEKLRGKPVKEETIEKISTVFFLLLIGLMILVTFNDIWYLAGK